MYCTAQWLELILQNFKEKTRCGIISIIPAFSRLRQRNSKFKTNLEKKKRKRKDQPGLHSKTQTQEKKRQRITIGHTHMQTNKRKLLCCCICYLAIFNHSTFICTTRHVYDRDMQFSSIMQEMLTEFWQDYCVCTKKQSSKRHGEKTTEWKGN